jgi:tetratricopeptide (TPR) repeat protein
MAELATLIFAITAFLGLCLVGAAIYRPSAFLKRFRRLKVWNVEVEVLDEKPAELPPAPLALPAAGETASPPPSSTSDTLDTPQTPGASDSWFWLLTNGRYDEGFQALRKAYADKAPSEGIREEAYFYWMAIGEGHTRAFEELRQHAVRHPDSFTAQFFYAASLNRVGQRDEALTQLAKAYSIASSPTDKLTAMTLTARLKVHGGLPPLDAARMIAAELGAVTDPSERAGAYHSIAGFFEDDHADPKLQLMMLEAAARNAPTDTSKLFDVAYAASDHNAHELSLLHNRRLLEIDSEHANGMNNAGVSAERLELPITAVNYYKQSEKAGNSLASANLATRLTQAGFVEEAASKLAQAKAQHGDAAHRNVDLNIGRAAEAQEQEDKRLKSALKRAAKVARWKALCAEAILKPQTTATGKFSLGNVKIEISADATVTGTVQISAMTEATIAGKIHGRFVSFTWKGAPPASVWDSPKTGHGEAILVSDSRLEGHYVEGDTQLDSAGADGWTEFVLHKQ